MKIPHKSKQFSPTPWQTSTLESTTGLTIPKKKTIVAVIPSKTKTIKKNTMMKTLILNDSELLPGP
jgi:hypothetical protein